MERSMRLAQVCGLAIVLVYTVLAFTAWRLYPAAYSPLTNWLSDLGNPAISSRGAPFYNAGILATAVLVAGLFAGLDCWRLASRRAQGIILWAARGTGMASVICLAFSALYPIDNLAVHSTFSTLMYILLSTAFALAAASLRYHPRVPRWVIALGFVIPAPVILSSLLPNAYPLEWFTVALLLLYAALLGWLSRPAGFASALS